MVTIPSETNNGEVNEGNLIRIHFNSYTKWSGYSLEYFTFLHTFVLDFLYLFYCKGIESIVDTYFKWREFTMASISSLATSELACDTGLEVFLVCETHLSRRVMSDLRAARRAWSRTACQTINRKHQPRSLQPISLDSDMI